MPAGIHRALLGATAVVAALLVAPSPAGAVHHLLKISEVYAGSAAAPAADFVELQLTLEGENLVTYPPGPLSSGVVLYNAAGTATYSGTFGADPPNGENQRTILAAVQSTDFSSTFPGVIPDLSLLPTGAGGTLGAGGSACFNSDTFGSLDCVGWGSGTAQPGGTSDFGPPAGAILDSQSIHRLIGANGRHDETDDTNRSANDFAPRAPTPCPNSALQPACDNPPGQPDGDGDGVPDSTDRCPNRPGPASNDGCPNDGGDDDDMNPPGQRVSGAEKQKVDKLALTVTPDEDATLVGTGRVSVPRSKGALKFREARKRAEADRPANLRFLLGKRALKVVKGALADGSLKARLKVIATDYAGNASTARQAVKLKD